MRQNLSYSNNDEIFLKIPGFVYDQLTKYRGYCNHEEMTYHKFLYNFIINSCIILITDMYISFYTITVNRTIELKVALL